MRCDEVREQVRQGRSTYLDARHCRYVVNLVNTGDCRNHPKLAPDEARALLASYGQSIAEDEEGTYQAGQGVMEEVDAHLAGCEPCRRFLVAERWRRFWRAPGPRSLVDALTLAHWVTRRAERFSVAGDPGRPIARIANTLLYQGIKADADEMEILPVAKGVQFRVCVDGVWQVETAMPAYIRDGLCARYKSMADLTVGATDVDQEGTIPIRYAGRHYDVSLTVTPTPFGEKITMRPVLRHAA